MAIETELKFRVENPAALRRQVRQLGFRITRKRTPEINWLFDDAQGTLRRQGKLLRLRQMGTRWLLTAKGPRQKGVLKRRAEFQSEVKDGPACRRLLELAGFHVTGSYTVCRALLARAGEAGALAWDGTPKGTYLEIEGTAAWVRRTARSLGLNPANAEPRSYPELLCGSPWSGTET